MAKSFPLQLQMRQQTLRNPYASNIKAIEKQPTKLQNSDAGPRDVGTGRFRGLMPRSGISAPLGAHYLRGYHLDAGETYF
jgi:hypothetical protein